ncbi:TPA: hypothetical protein N0F65_012160 [Lagenidium giganteum]|uniref:Myb-like domain-containing protein n=1 Tax=Lagenidium giganteum TaxID=4803 RepID=A0AAV2YSB3_9STRA|nr:TPA: hypothetical protein N0F65_012160 [Lagenidium giganteum]
MGRGRMWSSAEDEALVRSYVAISEDSVHGTEQKSATFWSAIHAIFKSAHRSDSEARSGQALRNRWQAISHDVSRFVECWSMVTARHESGKSADDVKSTHERFSPHNGGRTLRL